MRTRRRSDRNAARPRHATATLLLETVLEFLETMHMDEVSMAMVLERSGVSHGSLYHHFEDFPDLVEQAVVMRFEMGLTQSLEYVAALLDAADADDFRQRMEALILMLNDQARRPYRLYRAEVIGNFRGRPRLAAKIGRAQQEVIEAQSSYYAEFQRRGWLRTDSDPTAMSTFTVALFLGRVADDITEHPVDPELWNDVVLRAVRAVLLPD
jgi:AcrR family transcriptional regulator